jgi:hypothetical protein
MTHFPGVSSGGSGVTEGFGRTLPVNGPQGTTGWATGGVYIYLPLVDGATGPYRFENWGTINSPIWVPIGGGGPAAPANFKNITDGGDFTINPWQRNVPGLASGNQLLQVAGVGPVYFADRFFVGGGSSSAIVQSKVANTTVAGFGTALKVQRQLGNASLAPINMGQVVETANSIRAQGQNYTLSLWAASGASYSGGQLTLSIVGGTGTDQSAAAMLNGTWTGQTVLTSSPFTLTSAMTRISVTAAIPANITQLAILATWTPTGSAGVDDSVQFMGVQFESAGMSLFEHHDAEIDNAMAQRYCVVFPEPASARVVQGASVALNNQEFILDCPVTMRAIPSVTVGPGNWRVAAGNPYSPTTIAGGPSTLNSIVLTSYKASPIGSAAILAGGGGNGYILISADY